MNDPPKLIFTDDAKRLSYMEREILDVMYNAVWDALQATDLAYSHTRESVHRRIAKIYRRRMMVKMRKAHKLWAMQGAEHPRSGYGDTPSRKPNQPDSRPPGKPSPRRGSRKTPRAQGRQ